MMRRDVLIMGLGLGLMAGGARLLTPETRETQREAPLRFVFTTPTAPTLTWGSAFRANPMLELPREASAYPRIICFKPGRAAETWSLVDAQECSTETTLREPTSKEEAQ
jgi:hypothetical protein